MQVPGGVVGMGLAIVVEENRGRGEGEEICGYRGLWRGRGLALWEVGDGDGEGR